MPSTPETLPGFWRCRRCGTPNPRAVYLTKCLGCGRPIPPETLDEPKATAPQVVTPAEKAGRGRRTAIAAAMYASVVMASVGAIRGMSLGWWPVATLVFLPRWLFLIPLPPMAVGAIRSRRARVGALVALDAVLVLGPLMGLSVPVGRLFSASPAGPRVRIMTFNQGAARLDIARTLRYLDRFRVDVVCFQEPGKNEGLFEGLVDQGWHLGRDRRIASRFPIVRDLGRSEDVNKSGDRFTMTMYRAVLRHPDGFEFLVGSVHLPAPRRALARAMAGNLEGFRDHLAWWDEEAGRARELLAESGETPMLVAGDFNMPSDYGTMASIESRYPSAFEASGWGFGYTRPTALPWVRIDHVLSSREWTFARTWVGPDLGSDHLPLVAEAILATRPARDAKSP